MNKMNSLLVDALMMVWLVEDAFRILMGSKNGYHFKMTSPNAQSHKVKSGHPTTTHFELKKKKKEKRSSENNDSKLSSEWRQVQILLFTLWPEQ